MACGLLSTISLYHKGGERGELVELHLQTVTRAIILHQMFSAVCILLSSEDIIQMIVLTVK